MNKEKEKQELLLGLVSVANKGQELIPHKDYEIKQDGDRFYLVKKKKKYPKTYEECAKVLGTTLIHKVGDIGYKITLLHKLEHLLIARDAYWKLYGEEMGLGKPWEPDWNTSEPKYVIAYTSHGIEKQWETTYRKGLAFPTAEMRDAFKENFDPDIEICKELI